MKKMLYALLLILWPQWALAINLGSMRRSVFKIQTISQTADYEQPWSQKPVQSSSGTGFYIGKEGILTNAHVVADAKFLSVLRDGDDKPMSARVRFIAHDCDLALLEVMDPDYFKGTTPMTLADFPEVRESVNTIGYPTGGEQLSVTQGVVSRVSYRRYVHTGSDAHLLVQVDSAINAGNSGGPVVQNGKVVGVAFQAQTAAENTGYIIPTPVVRRFLKDIKDGHYDGHPAQGFWYMEEILENEATRNYHGLRKGEGGIKMSAIASYSPVYGQLQRGDIVTAIDGNKIGVDGKIVAFGERISFRANYDLKQRGDKVRFNVLRDGKRIDVVVKLDAKGPLYDPGQRFTLRPRFFVYAGLVFSALTRNYLQDWGRGWYYDAPLILRYLHNYAALIPGFESRRDIIVLSERLPHPVNTYAGPYMEEVLEKINGQPVDSVEDIPKIISGAKDEFLTFEFWKQKTPFVMARTAAEEANDAIRAQYRLPLREWFGGDDDDGANANWDGGGT